MARSVCCRASPARDPPVSSANRSSRRASSSSGDITRSRAAASSMPSGMPSSRRQIRPASCTARSSQPSGAPWAAARSASSRTASLAPIASASSPSAGTPSDGTRYTCSPPMPSGSRLVASSATFGHPRSSASASLAHVPMRCSQLSSTNSRRRPPTACTTASATGRLRLQAHPQHIRHRHPDQIRILERGQVGEPHPVARAVGQPGRNLQRQPGLAHPARAGQRDQPRPGQQPTHRDQLRPPADEARQLRRQVGRQRRASGHARPATPRSASRDRCRRTGRSASA